MPYDLSACGLVTVCQLRAGSSANGVAIANDGGGVYMEVDGNIGTRALRIQIGNTGFSEYSSLNINGSEQYVRISTANNERLRVISNGNVGIGTSSPSERLHIYGGGSGPELRFEGSWGSHYIRAYCDNFNILVNSSVTAISIRNNGHIGIGCTVPQTRLHVTDQAAYGIATFDSSTNGGYLIFQQTGVTKAYIQWGLTVAGSANGNYMLVTNDAICGSIALQTKSPTGCNNSAALVVGCTGNVGISTCAPTYRLHVNGTFYAAGSSQEYKTSICQYDTDSCMFMKLKPVTYQYKDEYKHLGKELKSGTQIGLIAEEVAETYPELAILVNEEENKVVRNVDYEKLSIVLLAEVQKLRKEVDDLKTK
jgi:hypothetical protein